MKPEPDREGERLQPKSWPWLMVVIIVGPLLVSLLCSREVQERLAEEGSVIEVMSAVAYFVGALLLACQSWRHWTRLYLAGVVLVLGLRELDFHNAFTTMSLTKLRFFTSAEVPLAEKGMGVLIYVMLGLLIWKVAVHYFPAFKTHLRQRSAYAILVGAGGLLAVVSKVVLDGLSRKLKAFGLNIRLPNHLLELIEENFECSLSLLILMAISLWTINRRREAEWDSGKRMEVC